MTVSQATAVPTGAFDRCVKSAGRRRARVNDGENFAEAGKNTWPSAAAHDFDGARRMADDALGDAAEEEPIEAAAAV